MWTVLFAITRFAIIALTVMTFWYVITMLLFSSILLEFKQFHKIDIFISMVVSGMWPSLKVPLIS